MQSQHEHNQYEQGIENAEEKDCFVPQFGQTLFDLSLENKSWNKNQLFVYIWKRLTYLSLTVCINRMEVFGDQVSPELNFHTWKAFVYILE